MISTGDVMWAFRAACSFLTVLSSSPSSQIHRLTDFIRLSLLSMSMVAPSTNQSGRMATTWKNRVFPIPCGPWRTSTPSAPKGCFSLLQAMAAHCINHLRMKV